VLGATTISTLMVVMITLNDLITFILINYFRISTTVASDAFGEVELTQV
jgi:hypothetical protein